MSAKEKVLLIDVSVAVAAALGCAGIVALMDVPPGEAAVALVDGENAVRSLSTLRTAAPNLPVLSLKPIDGVDAVADEDGIVPAVREWLVSGMMAALDRLAGVFGRDAIIGLSRGLSSLLTETDPDAMRAHRIAGLAGTLGLSALSRPWLAVSEGDDMAWSTAMRAADRARQAIADFAT